MSRTDVTVHKTKKGCWIAQVYYPFNLKATGNSSEAALAALEKQIVKTAKRYKRIKKRYRIR